MVNTLKPEHGIKIKLSNKYLYDPDYVQNEIDGLIDTSIQPLVDEATTAATNSAASALEAKGYADQAKETVDGFDQHALQKQNAFDVNAATLTARYDNNDLAKTKAFNENAQTMTDGFNLNVTTKIDDFDAHAMTKEIEFDDNAAIKQGEVDASANQAKLSEDNAKNSENASGISERKSRVWAEGEDAEVADLGGVHSSKGWAETAAAIVGEGVIQDDTISLKTTYSSDKLEKHFSVNEDHDSVLNCLDVLNDQIGEKTTVPLSSLQAIDSDSRPSHKAKGAEVYDEFGTMGIIDSVTTTEAVITTMESREKIRIVETLDIQKNGLGQYYVALTANQIRNEINKGKVVQLRFDDVITNTGEQLYPFETMDKDGYAVFRRNIITNDKAERINIKVNYQGIVTFGSSVYSGLTENNISNCLTAIPQDIKLEIDSNGKCWLKAGSKCYKPNGDAVITNRDLPVGRQTGNVEFVGINQQGTSVGLNVKPEICLSGDVAPTITSDGYWLWFDTKNKVIKYTMNRGQTWTDANCCLPFAIVKMKNVNGEVEKIDQVFNGFGYIGSTVFALPNVKGLIPDGRNIDGSLRSREFTADSVITRNLDNLSPRALAIGYYQNTQTFFQNAKGYILSDDNILQNDISFKPLLGFECAKIICDKGNITSFTPKTVFHALDYNDKKDITSWGFPSHTYANISLGENRSTYVAPANGHFSVSKNSTGTQQIVFTNLSNGDQKRMYCNASDWTANVDIDVLQGDTIRVDYDLGGATNYFRFYYAEGEV